MLTDQAIETAKQTMIYPHPDQVLHEHNDCIRIAYEWLDAQRKTKGNSQKTRAIKHIIEKWGGRYVSRSDVEVAAKMHPDITGTYPYFNISARLVLPSETRLAGIAEAKTQDYKIRSEDAVYALKE